MRSTTGTKLIFAAAVLAGLTSAGCQTDDVGDQTTAAVATSGATVRAHLDSAAGDVANESALPSVPEKWLTDANVLSLLTTMSAKQIAAADVELQGWHSDSVRSFAASIARDQAGLQHSVDSLAARLRLTPIAPALADPLTVTMQAAIDSLKQVRGGPLDRAFLLQQIAATSSISNYAGQLAAVAERPEIQAISVSAAASARRALTRARAANASLTTTDSLSASASTDSAAKRAARHKR